MLTQIFILRNGGWERVSWAGTAGWVMGGRKRKRRGEEEFNASTIGWSMRQQASNRSSSPTTTGNTTKINRDLFNFEWVTL
jgi:hypothetical protein